MKYFLGIVFITLFFGGCATKQPIQIKSVMVTIKTPFMKYNDLGFIKHYDNYNELEIYSFGNALLYLKVYKDKVCTSDFKCKTSQSFINEYFNSSYPADFFYNILNKSKNLNIQGITYSYNTEDGIYFRDKQNDILIRIKEDL